MSPVLKIPAFDETPIRLVFRETQRVHMDQAAGHRRASHGPRTAFPASIEQEALVMTKVILFALSTRVFLILRDVPYEDTHAMCQHLQVFHLLDRRGVQSVY